ELVDDAAAPSTVPGPAEDEPTATTGRGRRRTGRDTAPRTRVASSGDYFGGAAEDPIHTYLKEIGKVPLLSAELEVEMARRIEAGNEAAARLAAETRATEGATRDGDGVDGTGRASGSLEAAEHRASDPELDGIPPGSLSTAEKARCRRLMRQGQQA